MWTIMSLKHKKTLQRWDWKHSKTRAQVHYSFVQPFFVLSLYWQPQWLATFWSIPRRDLGDSSLAKSSVSFPPCCLRSKCISSSEALCLEEKGNTYPNYPSILLQTRIVFDLWSLARLRKWKGQNLEKKKKMWPWNLYCTSALEKHLVQNGTRRPRNNINDILIRALDVRNKRKPIALVVLGTGYAIPVCKSFCGCCYIRRFFVAKLSFLLIVDLKSLLQY